MSGENEEETSVSSTPAAAASNLHDKKMINIRLSKALWNRAKASAGDRGLTLERWVTDALEAHIRHCAQVAGGSPSPAAPAPAPATNDDLAWRVAALEAAVDYLAQAIGGGFPTAGVAPGVGSNNTSERE